MDIDGSCHCGKVTFTAKADPAKVALCNCTDCQTLSGAPFRVTVFCDEADLTLTAGAPKEYVKTAESGRKRRQVFCGDCGTSLYALSMPEAEGPRLAGLRWGAIRQRDELVPARQVWCRSAQPWAGNVAAIPGTETQ